MTIDQFVEVRRLQGALIELATAVAKGTANGIDVIRAYRTATGSLLGDSKRWYDGLRTDPPPSELDLIKRRLEYLEKWQASFANWPAP